MVKSTEPKQEESAAGTDKPTVSNGSPPEEDTLPKLTVAAQLRANVLLLERAVQAKDTRLIVGRLLRQTAAIRQELKAQTLKSLIQGVMPESCTTRSLMLEIGRAHV